MRRGTGHGDMRGTHEKRGTDDQVRGAILSPSRREGLRGEQGGQRGVRLSRPPGGSGGCAAARERRRQQRPRDGTRWGRCPPPATASPRPLAPAGARRPPYLDISLLAGRAGALHHAVQHGHHAGGRADEAGVAGGPDRLLDLGEAEDAERGLRPPPAAAGSGPLEDAEEQLLGGRRGRARAARGGGAAPSCPRREDGDEAGEGVGGAAAAQPQLDVGLGQLLGLAAAVEGGLGWLAQADAGQQAVRRALLVARVGLTVQRQVGVRAAGGRRGPVLQEGADEAELVPRLVARLDLEDVVVGGVDVEGEELGQVAAGVEGTDSDLGRVLEAVVLQAVVAGEEGAAEASVGGGHQQPRPAAAAAAQHQPHGGGVGVVGRDVQHAREDRDRVAPARREAHGHCRDVCHAAQLAEALVDGAADDKDALLRVGLQDLVVVVGEHPGVLTGGLRQLRCVAQRAVQHRPHRRLRLQRQLAPRQLEQPVDGRQVNAGAGAVQRKVVGEGGREELALHLQAGGSAGQ